MRSAASSTSTWEVNGQSIVRRPGSQHYIGTVTEDPAALYKAEQISYGYIPGTMSETQNEDGSWTRSGFDGVLDAATAQRLGGNYDAYGYWHSANGVSRYGRKDSGEAAYDQVFGPGAAKRDGFEAVKNFMSDWRANSTKGFFENVNRMDKDRYAEDLAKTRSIFSSSSDDKSDPDPRPDYSITKEYRDNYFVGSEDDEFGNLPYEPDPSSPSAPTSTPTSTSKPSSSSSNRSSNNNNNDNSNSSPGGGVSFSGGSSSSSSSSTDPTGTSGAYSGGPVGMSDYE